MEDGVGKSEEGVEEEVEVEDSVVDSRAELDPTEELNSTETDSVVSVTVVDSDTVM